MTAQVSITVDSDTVSSESYTVDSARPLLQRSIGKTIGGGDIVARYADPIWTIVFRLGPLVRTDTALLRSWVGESVEVLFEDSIRTRGDYLSAELWQNATVTGTLTKAVPRAINDDITQGDLWTLTVQAPESAIVAI